jgi:hypothetical protein
MHAHRVLAQRVAQLHPHRRRALRFVDVHLKPVRLAQQSMGGIAMPEAAMSCYAMLCYAGAPPSSARGRAPA